MMLQNENVLAELRRQILDKHLLSGRNFVLVMQGEEICSDALKSNTKGYGTGNKSHKTVDDFQVYSRFNQPCQGGEMRKYSRISFVEQVKHDTGPMPWEEGFKAEYPLRYCTQPASQKPGDLWSSFPKVGVLEGLAHKMSRPSVHQKEHNQLIECLFSNESPWKKGFGSSEDIELVRDDRDFISGVIFKNTDVDPTVLVNLLQARNVSDAVGFDAYLQAGMTVKEAIVTLMTIIPQPFIKKFNPTSNYYFPQYASIRRIIDADPNDLSFGTYRNGFDYNRKDVHSVFAFLAYPEKIVQNIRKQDNKNGVCVSNVVNQRYGDLGNEVDYNKLAKIMKEIIEEYYEKQQTAEKMLLAGETQSSPAKLEEFSDDFFEDNEDDDVEIEDAA